MHVQSIKKNTVFHCQICKFVGFLLRSSSWLLKLPIVRLDEFITRELTFILIVTVNEDALERERKNCDALRRRLSDFEAKAAQGTSMEPALADAKKRLHEAEAEVTRLKNALNKLKQQLQVLGISLR